MTLGDTVLNPYSLCTIVGNWGGEHAKLYRWGWKFHVLLFRIWTGAEAIYAHLMLIASHELGNDLFDWGEEVVPVTIMTVLVEEEWNFKSIQACLTLKNVLPIMKTLLWTKRTLREDKTWIPNNSKGLLLFALSIIFLGRYAYPLIEICWKWVLPWSVSEKKSGFMPVRAISARFPPKVWALALAPAIQFTLRSPPRNPFTNFSAFSRLWTVFENGSFVWKWLDLF